MTVLCFKFLTTVSSQRFVDIYLSVWVFLSHQHSENQMATLLSSQQQLLRSPAWFLGPDFSPPPLSSTHREPPPPHTHTHTPPPHDTTAPPGAAEQCGGSETRAETGRATPGLETVGLESAPASVPNGSRPSDSREGGRRMSHHRASAATGPTNRR